MSTLEAGAPRTRYVRSAREPRGVSQRLTHSLAHNSMGAKRALSGSPPRTRSPPRNSTCYNDVSPGRAPMHRMLHTASAEELVPQLIKKLSTKSHEVMSMKSMLDDSQRKVTELKSKLFSKSGVEKAVSSPGMSIFLIYLFTRLRTRLLTCSLTRYHSDYQRS